MIRGAGQQRPDRVEQSTQDPLVGDGLVAIVQIAQPASGGRAQQVGDGLGVAAMDEPGGVQLAQPGDGDVAEPRFDLAALPQ